MVRVKFPFVSQIFCVVEHAGSYLEAFFIRELSMNIVVVSGKRRFTRSLKIIILLFEDLLSSGSNEMGKI